MRWGLRLKLHRLKAGANQSLPVPKPAPKPAGPLSRPDMTIRWRPGDKVKHGKWGIGTIISVRGQGEETELQIAFPDQGIKGFMQKYAPIQRA